MNKSGFFPKYNVDYYVDSLKKNDIICFKNETFKRVIKHKKGTHVVTLEDGKEYDLYIIYDSILSVFTKYNDKDDFTQEHLIILVFSALLFITRNCKYHAYPDVVAALLNGDDSHYASEYLKKSKLYGFVGDVSEEYAKLFIGVP